MKKITLLKKEKVLYKVKFSIRIIFINLLLLLLTMSIAVKMNGGLISFLMLFLFYPLIVKTFFDLYRIFFARVYITNKRVISVRGYYLKRIRYYKRLDITQVLYKSNILDFKKNMTSFKFILKDNQHFTLRNVKNGTQVVELLSEHIIRKNNNTYKQLQK